MHMLRNDELITAMDIGLYENMISVFFVDKRQVTVSVI